MHPHDAFHPSDDQRPDGSRAPSLSAEDARILDRLVEAGFDVDACGFSADDRVRAERLTGYLGLLDAYPIDAMDEAAADGLLDATMARIDQDEAERAGRMRLDPERGTGVGGRRFRFPDLVAVASIAILAAVVLVPIANWRNARALDTRCENNMRMIAEGIDVYTRTFDGAMPMTASLLPDVAGWLGYRNADNLHPLKAGHYCPEGCLCCPGDHDPNGCYAYQVTLGERRPAWQNGPRVAVVGDRNPLVDLKRNGQTVASVALNSASHGGRGQNILSSDGSILFANSPYLPVGSDPAAAGGLDNIWLPFGDRPDALTQRPGSGVDAFLLH